MIGLFEQAQKREVEDKRFLATLLGAELSDDKPAAPRKTEIQETEGWFKDPEYYKDWTEEQKQAETERMMGIHMGRMKDMTTRKE